MRAVVASAILLSMASCKDEPSKLDQPAGPRAEADPWAASFGTAPAASGDADASPGGLGFDLQGALAKIKRSIETPGRYEAPLHSGDHDAGKPHWGVMRLAGDVVEREAFSLTGGGQGTELRVLAGRLRALARQTSLSGLVLRVDELAISFPDIVELRAAMADFRAAGKQLRCHAESASNATYMVLASCDRVGLSPLGEIAITGPAAMPVHVKPLLDRLAVEADFVHVGAYKGAAEPLTRVAPSPEMEETLGAILDRRYQSMVDTISQARKLDAATVRSLIDTALFPAGEAKAAGLVDDVVSWEAFRDGLSAPWTRVELEPDDDDQLATMMKLARFLGAMPAERPAGDHVAVVYALGDIVDGPGDGLIGARQQIASHTLVAALRALAADTTVKAVVLRIDSGGGSARASELIWEALEQLEAAKPVVVSMSDVAASGGYYIASGATRIYAHDDTLTGSIGVVGGRIAPAQALARVGVHTFPMGRGKHATMTASLSSWTADERALIRTHMEAVYTTFVQRVAAGRKMTADQVQPLAQGRVWTGRKAKELGLVDEIGGLDAAIAEARRLGKVEPASELEIYPPAPTLRDVLAGWGQVSVGPALALDTAVLAELRVLHPEVARSAARLLRLVQSFRTTPVQAVTVVPVLN